MLEIGENLKVLMSEERMAVLCQEIDEWAAEKAKEDSMEVSMDVPRPDVGNLRETYWVSTEAASINLALASSVPMLWGAYQTEAGAKTNKVR